VRERVASAVPWQIVARVGLAMLAVATSAVVAGGLGAQDYGRYTILQNLLVFGLLGISGGLGPALARFVPEIDLRSPGGVRAFVGRCLRFHLAAWIVLTIATQLQRPALSQWFDPVVGELAFAAMALLLT